MATSDSKKISVIAGTTFAESALYTGVTLNATGHAIIPDTTDVTGLVIGTLYGVTSTTNAAGSQAVEIGVGPKIKVQMAASTLAAGDTVGFSTLGLGIAPTTDAAIFGIIQQGSSGGAGRLFTVIRTGN
jgi:hypothetical protein